jgi:hypothetical protein
MIRQRIKIVSYHFLFLFYPNFVKLNLYLYLKIVDVPIIQNNTQYVVIRNKRLRIVHIINELGAKVPLIVFIHGLGGQVG